MPQAPKVKTPLGLEPAPVPARNRARLPGFYARDDPELAGIPFFYWYQVAWILLSAIITAIVYRATPE